MKAITLQRWLFTNKILFALALSCMLLTDAVKAQNRPYIVDRPVIWNTERERLSREYMLSRHGIVSDTALIDPRMVVVHYTANMSVNETLKTFNPVRLPGRPNLQTASQLNVSTQFVVSRNGTIYQLMPDNFFARHTIGLNYCSIGIENIGTENNPLTEAQLAANARLIRYLQSKYQIDYVIGHHEYQQFRTTNFWKETNPSYITQKRDPGDIFIRALRERLGMSKELSINTIF